MRPESSPEALEMARACVHVHGDHGVAYVGYRVPGSTPNNDHGLTYAHFGNHNSTDPRGDAERAADDLACLLAPLVDLGLRRAEAARLRPLPRMEPAANDDPDQNLDPDD